MKHARELAVLAAMAFGLGCTGESSRLSIAGPGAGSGGSGSGGGGPVPGNPGSKDPTVQEPGPKDTDPNDPPVAMLPPFSPGPQSMRRLMRHEYEQSVRDLLDQAVAVPPLEGDTAISGLPAIGAATLTLSRSGVDRYEEAALAIAAEVMRDPAKRAKVVPCAEKEGKSCVRTFVQTVGRRAWRRELTQAEVDRYVAVADTASTKLGNFWSGLEFALVGILQSPYFLYRTELGQPDPASPGQLRLTPEELASKLSYFLTGSLPDEELLAAAQAGELETTDQIQAHARRLLKTPQARQAMRAFWIDFLELHDFESLAKAPELFPHMTQELAVAMKEETLRVMDHLAFDAQADMRTLFTTKVTFLNPLLAKHYGLEDLMSEQKGFQKVTFPEGSQRAGILTHAAFLTRHSNPDVTSPTHRGLFIRQGLLCETVNAPPPTIETTVPPAEPGSHLITYRQRLEHYTAAPLCAGCHAMMDPLGFPFEGYDAVGQLRALDDGQPVDDTGAFGRQRVTGALELGQALSGSRQVMDCIVRKVYRHAAGRVEGAGEARVIKALGDDFEAANFRFQDLLISLVSSPGFLTLAPSSPAEASK